MKEKAQYTEAFRKQALEKVYTRGRRSVKAVAEELNISPFKVIFHPLRSLAVETWGRLES